MVRTILLTGFEPFAGSTLNPSQRIVESLTSAEPIAGVDLHPALLPVDTQAVGEAVRLLLNQVKPDAVIHVGEAASASKIRIERLAVNLLDFDRLDNAGTLVRDAAIEPGGPAARWATLNCRAAEAAVKRLGIPVELSLSAGAYLCNQVLYLSLLWSAEHGGCDAGFVHVPSLPEQVEAGERSEPAMELSQSLAAVRAVVQSCVAERE